MRGETYDVGDLPVVLMAEPPKAFATRRHGESHGVGTWRMLARVVRVKNPV